MRHFYVYNAKIISLQEVKDQAERISTGNRYTAAEEVKIHIHKYGDLCTEHEHLIYYTPKQKEDLEAFTKLTTKEKEASK